MPLLLDHSMYIVQEFWQPLDFIDDDPLVLALRSRFLDHSWVKKKTVKDFFVQQIENQTILR